MRAWWMAGLLAWLVGCPSSEQEETAATRPAPTAELRIEGDQSVTLLPGDRPALSVRYVDANEAPQEGKWVEFGLTGSPEGASLDPPRSLTDADGVARTTLVAGRSALPFRVRASAEGVDPQYFDVLVGSAIAPTLTVSVAYTGKRIIASNSVLVVEGMTCDLLRSNATDVRTSNLLPLMQKQTFPLGAGRRYAIAAWGSDDTNSKLAWGCRMYEAPISNEDTDSSEPWMVKLEDIAFSADTAIPLNFSFDLKPALATLAPLARTLVADALPKTSTPQASFLLDALQTKVNFASTRKSDGLDAVLQAALDTLPAGPLRFAEALAAAVAEDGATCLLQGSLTPVGDNNVSTLTLSPPVYAVPSDSVAKEVSLSALPLNVEFSARYDQDLAAVAIRALKISLGFGSYVAYLLDGVGPQQARYAERVAARTGCDELGALVALRPASFAGLSETDAVAACESSLTALVPKIRSKWAALDEQRNTISLVDPAVDSINALAVHDRDGDKKVDDLGPAMLTATWSSAGATPTADTTAGVSVRMSPVTVSAR